MHKVRDNYSSCTVRSSENISSSSSGGAALRKEERQDETQFTTQIDGFLSFIPPLNANAMFCRFCFESHPVYDQTQGSGAVFFLLYG